MVPSHLPSSFASAPPWHRWQVEGSSPVSNIVRNLHLGVEPKIGGKTPKMDGGENHGKPYEQMDDLEGKPTIFRLYIHL